MLIVNTEWFPIVKESQYLQNIRQFNYIMFSHWISSGLVLDRDW